MLHLGALLDAACSHWPARAALLGDGGDLSYADLDKRAAIVAAALRAGAIAPDEPVAVRVSNHTGDVTSFLGVWRAGGVVVPIHRTALANSVEALIARSGARFIVDGDNAEPVMGFDRPPVEPRDMLCGAALIIFTSGTTGQPKGVVLSHEGFAGKLVAIDSMLSFNEETRTLMVLQLTFSFGQWVSLLTLARGGVVTMHEKFDASRVLSTLARQPITRFAAIPTMLRAMLPVLRGSEGAVLLNALNTSHRPRLFMAGGEPLPYPLGRAFRATMPHLELCDIYGLTETSTSDFILPPADQDRFPGTIGRPTPGVDFAIHDEQGHILPNGRTGELVIRTPFIMRGYLDAPELTAAAFRNGYFRTGDLAQVTADGVVQLVGRLKELILRAGNKISPIEIERAYLEHPDIAETLATGIPDERLGEAIHLLAVPVPGAALSPEALRAWAAARLDRFKIPDVIHISTSIPLGRTGKADRAALKAQLMTHGSSI